MNDNINNNEAPRRVQPIAKTSSQKPVASATQKKQPENDLFGAVYRQQKTSNEQQEIEKQKQLDKELTRKVAVPVVVNPEAELKKEEENKKFKIVFIVLTILTVVLFVSSVAFLVFRLLSPGKDIQDDTQAIPVNTISTKLESPFNYQKVYNVEFPEGIKEEYKDLYAANQDFIGWLTVPGTLVDMPVYQHKDKADYYLKHDQYMTYTKFGVAHIDPICDMVNLSRNTTIHGHNFGDGMWFDDIQNYEDPEFCKENPVITFSTLYKEYKFKVIGAFRSNGSNKGDNGYLFYYVASSFGDNSLMKFHDEILQRSYIHTGVDVQPGDKLLTLSTCTYFFDVGGSIQNARFAVIARLVREGESEYVDTSLIKANDNVRYPQLYYTVFGGTNPWVNASKWVPEAD